MNKVALVTGGARGIGRAICLELAQSGYNVVINYLTSSKEAKELQKQIEDEYHVRCLTYKCDVSSTKEVDEMITFVEKEFKGVDVLVNNAGVLEEGLKPIDRVNDDDLDRILDINTKGTMYCMRAASAEMSKTGTGSIVNVASVAGVMGCGGAAYVSSKAAIIGVTKHTALRFAGTGIRCNAVCPGTIVTPMVAAMNPANMDADMFGQMAKHSDLKVQPCMPEDVANILLFLASDESRAITGQALVTDFGGTL